MTKPSTKIQRGSYIQQLMKSPLVSFLAVGGLATGTQYLILIVFVEYFAWHKVASSAAAYALSAILNYYLNYHLTFASKQSHAQSFAKFSVVALAGLIMNTAIFKIVLLLDAHYLLAQLIATVITTITNYLLHKHWIYRNKDKIIGPESTLE